MLAIALRLIQPAFLGIALCCASSAAAESNARRYAVISLVGDSLTLVTHQMATASRIDRNIKQTMPDSERSMDGFVLGEVDRIIGSLDAHNERLLLSLPEAEAFALGEGICELPAVQDAIRAESIERIVLVTKLRAPARMRFQNGSEGDGKVEGIGFYLDRTLHTEDGKGRTERGFLAPFAFMKLALLDGHTFNELGSKSVTASAAISAAVSDERSPWDAFEPEEKVAMVKRLIQESLRREIPKLLGYQAEVQ